MECLQVSSRLHKGYLIYNKDLYCVHRPVVITDIVPAWNAYKTWSKHGFLQKFGDIRVLLKVVQVTQKRLGLVVIKLFFMLN